MSGNKRFIAAVLVLASGFGATFVVRRDAPRDRLPIGTGVATAASGEVRNIILFIGDGMSPADEAAASRYLSGRDAGLVWHAFPHRAFVTTWSIDTYDARARQYGRPGYGRGRFDPLLGYDPSRGGPGPYPSSPPPAADEYFLGGGLLDRTAPATDSAAAATAIATGRKTVGGNVSWRAGDPKDGALPTIAERLRAECDAAVGVVTTVPFPHATAAAFVSHNTNRNHYYTGRRMYRGKGIADEMLRETKPEVVIGGGNPRYDNPGWSVLKGYISRDLYEELRSSDEYVFVERRPGQNAGAALAEAAETAASSRRRLFGLFGGPGGDCAPPKPVDRPGEPSVLRRNDENPLLAESVLAALTVLGASENGFFLMAEQGGIDWANHDHDYAGMVGSVRDLDRAVRAALEFVDRPGDAVGRENTVIIVTSDHGNGMLRARNGRFPGKGDLPRQERALGKWVYPDEEVRYRADGHTNELVGLYAIGAGAGVFEKLKGSRYPGTEIIDNTQLYEAMAAMTGLVRRGEGEDEGGVSVR